ncbi:MAG: hypothetical protein AB7O39_00350 [Flavobacteriaceae bacterium]
MKLGAALLLTCGFVACLLLIWLAHARWFPVDVVFYAALADVALATALTAIGAFVIMRRRMAFTGLEKILLVLVWLLGGYGFAITLPTMIDRSLSFYILEKLDQRGGGIRRDAMAQIFREEYLPEFRLVDVRLTEQVASGTIEIESGCVRLTPRGRFLARVGRYLRENLMPRERLLSGIYTDALTRPYAASDGEEKDYGCR